MEKTEKRCPRCGETKPIEGFSRNRSREDGRQGHCKKCFQRLNGDPVRLARIRNSHLKRRYGITFDQYLELLKKQGGKCKLCRKESRGRKKYRLAVDHIHGTTIVRGLLCVRCNVLIGYLQKESKMVEKAMRYIEGYR